MKQHRWEGKTQNTSGASSGMALYPYYGAAECLKGSGLGSTQLIAVVKPRDDTGPKFRWDGTSGGLQSNLPLKLG